MIPRGKLDISFSALFSALSYTMANLLKKNSNNRKTKNLNFIVFPFALD